MLHVIFNGSTNNYVEDIPDKSDEEEEDANIPRISAADPTYINIYPPNYKFHSFLNGSIQLQILSLTDPSKCYRYFQDKKTHRCLKCKNKKFHSNATLAKDTNGQEYIKMKAAHVCEPSTYYDSSVVRYSNFEHYSEQLCGEELIFGAELFLFVEDSKSFYYRFYYDNSKNYYVCVQCNRLHKLTEAVIKVDDSSGAKYVEAESIHACQPLPYIAKIKPPAFEVRQNGSRLVVFVASDHSKCFQYSWDKKRKAYICLSCSKKNKYVKAKIWKVEESDERFVQHYDYHECEPVPTT